MNENKVEAKSWVSKARLAFAGFLIIAGAVYVSSAQASGCEYVVKQGNTLSNIAQELGLSWKELYNANEKIIGSNPNLIRPGMRFDICYGTGGPTENELKLEPVAKPINPTATRPALPITPALAPELCQYTNNPDGSPRLVISKAGECPWNWTSAVGDGPFSVWPADVLADKEIAKATNTGCPPDYRDGSHFCWDGGKIVGGPVRIRPTGQVITIEAVGGQQIPTKGGGKDCYGEILPSGAWIRWCAPKQSP